VNYFPRTKRAHLGGSEVVIEDGKNAANVCKMQPSRRLDVMVVFDEASPMLADVMWLQMVFACCVCSNGQNLRRCLINALLKRQRKKDDMPVQLCRSSVAKTPQCKWWWMPVVEWVRDISACRSSTLSQDVKTMVR